MTRTRVKICGITNIDDAGLAVELGADALGFIFVRKSPRCIKPAAARRIIDALPPFVIPVAVTVNEPLEALQAIMTESGCRVAQLHGEEPPELLDELGWPAVKGISILSPDDLAAIARYPKARAVLLDTRVAGQHGGTGQSFDWRIAREAQRFGKPVILAGGLSPDNIAGAIHIAQPFMVDISSRIECEPGKKDPELMRRLFAAVAECGR